MVIATLPFSLEFEGDNKVFLRPWCSIQDNLIVHYDNQLYFSFCGYGYIKGDLALLDTRKFFQARIIYELIEQKL